MLYLKAWNNVCQYFRYLLSNKMNEMAGHVARMGKEEVRTGFLCKELREGENLEDSRLDGRVILKRIFKN